MALRTNSKQAQSNLWKYVRAYMLDEMEEAKEWTEKEDKIFAYDDSNTGISKYMLDCFNDEYLHEYNRNLIRTGRASKYELFKSWAQGLALGSMFCYYYNREAKQDVKNILEETQAEADRFTEEQAEELLTRLIYNAITKEAEKSK